MRVCPFGTAWGVTATGTTRPYRECSDQGVCNRGTGECECYDGYTGSACQRTTCPSGCSGHGQCQTIGTWGFSGAWDSAMTQACKCDPGYEGPSCAARKCPRGDDPLSTNQDDDVQHIYIASSGGSLSGSFALQLTGWDGQVFTTRALDIATVTATTVKEAIQALPNNAFPSVEVGVTGSVSTTIDIVVTFTSADNTGAQPAIVLVTGNSNSDDHGNQPVLTTLQHLDSNPANTKVTVLDGTKEGLVCSGRGSCSTDTGLCTCHQGFYGASCNMQTALQ